MDIGKEIGTDIGNTLKEVSSPIIALFPGKMKPPHKGHFTVVREACKIADGVIVIISQKYKDEFGPSQSKKIWEQYKKFLPNNVTIKIAKTPSPITDIYETIKDKSNDYLVVYGKGEESRYESISKNKDKYNNVEIVNAGNFENVSSTDLREAIRKRNLNQIQTFLPEGIQVDKFMYNFSVHEGKISESLLGGIADHATIEDIATMHKVPLSKILQQLDKGVKVEMEHTKFEDVAHEIAMDHIYEDPQYYDKLVTIEEETIDEGKQLGTLYHFTKVSLIEPILTSNELKSSVVDMTAQFSDADMEYFKKRGHKGDEAHYISFTRDKLLYKKNPKIKGSSARIVFDGDKLSNNQKFSPFYYYSGEITDEDSRFTQSEGEERLILKNQSNLKDVKKYIKEIHILLDVIMDSHFLLNAKDLDKSMNPLIKFYWKEREIKLQDWINNELPKIEPYRDEEFQESTVINEIYTKDKESILQDLIQYCTDQLGIDTPEVELIDDENYSQNQHSFGGYSPSEQKIHVVVKNRHTADIMRTLAHELVHHKQNINGELEDGAGKDGDKFENEANAQAAVFMRQFGKNNPQIFE